ncbi:hypothetical protein BN1088_1530005 [Sphingobacterium sp. PM2-P1-29]|nr:hypothetical protein BN1088_1530005 [Sphingobacterium sp. PM2-P1-29]
MRSNCIHTYKIIIQVNLNKIIHTLKVEKQKTDLHNCIQVGFSLIQVFLITTVKVKA